MLSQKLVRINLVYLVLLLTLTTSNSFAKEKQKVLKCSEDKCGFAIEFIESKEPKMIYKTHMQNFHEIKLSEEEIEERMKVGNYEDKVEGIKHIDCELGDRFNIYSKEEKEIKFWYGGHSNIVHSKEYKDADLDKKIKK